MIKVMTEAGDVAGAQGVILGELESQFGGVARAAADTSTGAFVQFQNAMGDVKESLGGVIADAFAPLAEKLTDVAIAIADSVNNSRELSDAFKALEDGTATADQKLVSLTTQLVMTKDAQAKATAINRSYADNFTETIKKLEEDIALEKQRIRYLAYEAQFAKAAEEEEKNRTAAITENSAAVEENIPLLDERAEKERDYLQERLDAISIEAEAAQGLRDAEAMFSELQTEEAEKRLQEIEDEKQANIDLYDTITSQGFAYLNAIDSYRSAVADAELQRLEEAGASEEELDAKKKQIAHDEAVRKKQIGTVSAIVDTASAIIGFLANPGGFAGIALSAAAGVTGAIQLAAINAAPVPAFATGGNFVTDGPQMIMVGDNPGGRERVSVTPQGSANLNGGGGTNRLILEILPRGLVKPMQTVIDNQEVIIR
jgi:hypothetical protein